MLFDQDNSFNLSDEESAERSVYSARHNESTLRMTPENLGMLLRGDHQVAPPLDTSWTSSLATPNAAGSVLQSQLNTEERNVFLPSENANILNTTQESQVSSGGDRHESLLPQVSSSRLSKRLFSPQIGPSSRSNYNHIPSSSSSSAADTVILTQSLKTQDLCRGPGLFDMFTQDELLPPQNLNYGSLLVVNRIPASVSLAHTIVKEDVENSTNLPDTQELEELQSPTKETNLETTKFQNQSPTSSQNPDTPLRRSPRKSNLPETPESNRNIFETPKDLSPSILKRSSKGKNKSKSKYVTIATPDLFLESPVNRRKSSRRTPHINYLEDSPKEKSLVKLHDDSFIEPTPPITSKRSKKRKVELIPEKSRDELLKKFQEKSRRLSQEYFDLSGTSIEDVSDSELLFDTEDEEEISDSESTNLDKWEFFKPNSSPPLDDTLSDWFETSGTDVSTFAKQNLEDSKCEISVIESSMCAPRSPILRTRKRKMSKKSRKSSKTTKSPLKSDAQSSVPPKIDSVEVTKPTETDPKPILDPHIEISRSTVLVNESNIESSKNDLTETSFDISRPKSPVLNFSRQGRKKCKKKSKSRHESSSRKSIKVEKEMKNRTLNYDLNLSELNNFVMQDSESTTSSQKSSDIKSLNPTENSDDYVKAENLSNKTEQKIIQTEVKPVKSASKFPEKERKVTFKTNIEELTKVKSSKKSPTKSSKSDCTASIEKSKKEDSPVKKSKDSKCEFKKVHFKTSLSKQTSSKITKTEHVTSKTEVNTETVKSSRLRSPSKNSQKSEPSTSDPKLKSENLSEMNKSPSKIDKLKQHDMELAKLDDDISALLDSADHEKSDTSKTDHGKPDTPKTRRSTRTLMPTSRIKTGISEIVQHARDEAKKFKNNKILYPNKPSIKNAEVLQTNDLQKSALQLEKAKLKTKLKSSIPKNQNEPVLFNNLLKNDEEDDDDEDVELLIGLLDADESLFSKQTTTSTPLVKSNLQDLDLSPIKHQNVFELSSELQTDSKQDHMKFITPTKDLKTQVGFCAGKGKQLSVSRQALVRAQNMMATINEESTTNQQSISPLHIKCSTPLNTKIVLPEINETPIPKIVGFTTASGENIKLSEKSLQKARILLQEKNLPPIPESEIPLEPKNLFPDEPKPNFVGFQTAKGNAIKISDSALAKGKVIFGDNILENSELETVSLFEPQIEDSLVIVDKIPNVSHKCDNSQQNNEDFCSLDEDFMCQVNELEETAIKKLKTQKKTSSVVKPELSETSQVKNQTSSQKSNQNSTLIKQSGTTETCNLNFENDDMDDLLVNFCETSNIDAPPPPPEEKLPEILQGFSTAAGNKINISEKSLKKAKRLLEVDLEIDTKTKMSSSKRSADQSLDFHEAKKIKIQDTESLKCDFKFEGFSTASGKSVKVSEKALEAAKKLFSDSELSEVPTTSGYEGFSSARGKKGENAIQAAKKRFHESGKQFSDVPNTSSFGNFSTASEKKVTTSDDVMKTDNIFPDSDNKFSEVLNSSSFRGFSTASGKKVNISEKAMQAANKMFSEPENERFETPSVSCFVGFATSKNDKNSKDSITDEKLKFTDSGFDSVGTPKSSKLGGFATASGKSVQISETAILAAKKMFSDSEFSDTPNTSSFEGFNTASGKNIKISEKAIQAAKKMFCEPENGHSETPSIQSFGGFATASGNKVTISADAIQAAKLKFADSGVDNVETPKSSKIGGFATASGKRVQISEKAIQAAKMFFSKPENEFSDTPDSKNVGGFSTASGKNVKISEKAILSAKKRFSESVNNFSEVTDIFSCASTSGTPSEQVNQAEKSKFCQAEVSSLTKETEEVTLLDMSTQSSTQSSQTPRSPILKRVKSVHARKRKLFETAREEQKLVISNKSKKHILPVPGKLLKLRQAGQNLIQLKDIPNSNSSSTRSELLEITSQSAANHRFKLENITKFDDISPIIPNNLGLVGPQEIESALFSSPGVDPKLIPEDNWVVNHYRWIIWKLAAMERKFPETLQGYFSLENVLTQLKFRYDREVDLVQRSCLRRITEKDSGPGSRLVLCVAGTSPDLVLTDGWYSIKAKIDEEMTRLIRIGKVMEGTKLMIHGAELESSVSGCHPLQQPAYMVLKISTNSTRRATWDARLGFCKSQRPMFIQLSSVLPYGGLIGGLRCQVARVYPPLFAEHSGEEKKGTVVRGERAEQARAENFQTSRQRNLDKILAEESSKLGKEREQEALLRRKSAGAAQQESARRDGALLCLALEADPDLHDSLTESQCVIASEWNRDDRDRWSSLLDVRVRERASIECSTRSVSPLLKLRLVPVNSSHPSALLSIWRPDPELFRTETSTVQIFGCVASGKRSGELCLNSTKMTKIVPEKSTNILHHNLIRTVTPISALDESDFQPIFNEIDLVGVVSNIEPLQPNNLQNIILCDSIGYQVIVCFWGGLQSHGLSQLIVPGVSISASNLQWKKIRKYFNNISLTSLQATEISQFSRQPNEYYLKLALQNLRATLDPEITIKNLKQCLTPTVKCVESEKPKSKEFVKRMSALSKYGEPPPISPLPVVPTSRFSSSFQTPSKADSPPLSLSQ